MSRLVLIALLFIPSAVRAETPLLVLAGRATDNEFLFGRNAASPPILTQRVLSASNPSLLGLAPAHSVIKAHSSIAALSGSIQNVTKPGPMESDQRVIITATNHNVISGALVKISGVVGFESVNATWHASKVDANSFRLDHSEGATGDYDSGGTWTTPNRFVTAQSFGAETAAALVSGLTIDGQKHTVGQQDIGQGANPNLPFIADGVALDSQIARIEANYIKGFQGAGVIVGPGHIVRDNRVSFCFTGIRVISSDTMVTDNIVDGIRDYGIYVVRNAGNTVSQGNHFFGCNNQNGDGAACFIESGGSFRANNDIYADTGYGINAAGALHQFNNCLIQHCWHRGVLLRAPGSELHGCQVLGMLRSTQYPGTVAVEFAHERCGMFDGSLELTSYIPGHLSNGVASEGLWIGNDGSAMPNGCRARTRLIDGDGLDGTIGVRVKRPVIGGEFQFWCYGFHQSNDRLLIIDSAAVNDTNSVGTTGMRNCIFHFYGVPTAADENIDTTNPTKYVTVPAGLHNSNIIVLHNTSTGESVQLSGPSLSLTKATQLTIASGAITPTNSYHTVDTEGSAASDDLDTINGGIEGNMLLLRAANSARTVVVKDGAGNIQCAGDCSLDNAQDTISLVFDGTSWVEVSRSNSGS